MDRRGRADVRGDRAEHPAKTLLAGLVAVSMNPVGMLIARAQGPGTSAPATDALLMHYPDYLLVGVAVVISHVVTGAGPAGGEGARDGKLSARRAAGARRDGRGLQGDPSHAGAAGGDQADPARDARRRAIRPAAQLAIARFRREAEAAANLRSPHTVELYDFGVTDDQTLYFVMELLEGMDLESLVGGTARAGGACGSHSSPGLRVTRRGARARPGASRHQAGQHPSSGGSGCRTTS